MVAIPRFETMKVDGYALFPGRDKNQHITVDFTQGLTVIAGINGLGKTTLLTLMLRMLTGPYDIQATGAPSSYEAVLKDTPVRLRGSSLSFFAQRVADGAADAQAELIVTFGDERLTIRRELATLKLTLVKSDRHPNGDFLFDQEERDYQSAMAELFRVGTFVDVLLLLHNVVFLNERRASALWDHNGQRHILGAMILDKELSNRFGSVSRALSKTDSEYRNTRAQAGRYRDRLDALEAKGNSEPGLTGTLQTQTTALNELRSNLRLREAELMTLDESYRERRRTLEEARLNDESKRMAVERAKYTSLMHLFPKMEDAAKLLLSRILSEEECLVCGAEAVGKKAELEARLESGGCPACGAASTKQSASSEKNRFEEKKLQGAQRAASAAADELLTAKLAYEDATRRRRETLIRISGLQREIANLEDTREVLKGRLPPDSDELKDLRLVVDGLEQTRRSEHASLLVAVEAYSSVLDTVATRINAVASSVSERFSSYIDSLLEESARLDIAPATARIGQESVSRFEFPSFFPAMTGATKSDQSRRQDASDVSESQRELIDLAFRLALLDVLASSNGGATFVMETPEASLDALAMQRVGSTLHDFWNKPNRGLVMTNNLTNTGLVSAVFGGSSAIPSEQRFNKVFSLLEHAAPNAALKRNKAEYDELLRSAVLGTSS